MRDELGKPFFEFSEKAKEILKTYSDKNFALTISHDNDMAAAVVFADFDENYTRFVSAVQKSDVENENIISFKTAKKLLPKRAENSHKGTFGRAFAVAGSTGFTGAARLACEAILKTGSGLITLGTPRSLNNIFEITLKEVMTYPLCDDNGILTKDAFDDILKFAQKCNVCLIGCGMSLTDGTRYIVENIVKQCENRLLSTRTE